MNPEDFESPEEATAQIAADQRIKEANAGRCRKDPFIGGSYSLGAVYGPTERAQDRAFSLVQQHVACNEGELPGIAETDRILAIVRDIHALDLTKQD